MSPSQASSDDFPRLTGARNFDVWKARVSASLDGKHLLGFVMKKDYDGVRDDEDDSSSDDDDTNVSKSPKAVRGDTSESNEVDYADSADDLQPDSDGEDESAQEATSQPKPHPVIRPFNHRKAHHSENKRVQAPSTRRLRRMEAQTKAFLMKTMDDTHV